MIPNTSHYWLTHYRVPISVLQDPSPTLIDSQDPEGLTLVNIEVQDGYVRRIEPYAETVNGVSQVDGRGGQLWPCFIDMHTHFDKAHMWPRTPNPDGSFQSAVTATYHDLQATSPEDLYRRVEFSLKCSYAHGTQAVRTHTTCFEGLEFFDIIETIRHAWADRVVLQTVSITQLANFMTPFGEAIADKVAQVNGALGGVTDAMSPELPRHLDRVFELAQERGLDLDFHTDESGDPSHQSVQAVAEAALRHNFHGQIMCDHCCSLAVQPPEVVQRTLELVKEAGIGIISLPMCNLYLQDRKLEQTPRWRGVTLLNELKRYGIPTVIASDNCRDPFLSFGDHDGWEVFNQSVRIAHLDQPYGDWPQAITTTPANLMQLPTMGRIGVGLPADLILFKGRGFSEWLSRSQHDRVVLRRGIPIDTTLPDYAELDDLMAR